jgi:SAM-dependent methyltransferase
MTTRRPSTKLVNQTDAVLPPSPVASLSLVARGEAMTTPGQARDEWNGVAAGYDQFATPLVIPLAEQVLGRVDVRRGTRLLDVAAGTGALSLAAARLGAHVVATDIAPAMIERLQARAQQERLKNLQGRVMDALEVLHITWVRRGLMKAGRPDRCSWRRYCVGHEAPDLAGRPVDLHAARDPHLRSAPVGVLSPATGPSVGDAGIGNSTSTTTGPFELPAMLLICGGIPGQ